MKIDAHQHFWEYNATEFLWIDDSMKPLQRDFLAAHSRELLQRCGFDAAIAVQARPLLVENDWLLSLARDNPHIAAIIGWIDLFAEDASAQLEKYFSAPQIKGFRAMLQDTADAPAAMRDPLFNCNAEYLQKQGGIYEILLRGDQLAELTTFCARHDKAPLVIDHLAKPFYANGLHASENQSWRRQMAAVGKLPHVYMKVSGLISELEPSQHEKPDEWSVIFAPFLDYILEAFGTSRLIFGSDWPVCLLGGTYPQSVEVVQHWAQEHLPESERKQLFGSTAQAVYLDGVT